ncbi:hypothetical protein HYDPIDRAFT_175437 [Hydnomerulius pinastri MD-312]|uniref:Uncharacterized protein n=1 Tax=Hydnomerulius pinastri MD-312 TaxID=994086 RepID=A0A0C9VFV8_9AGAM|nr:hypothetical protein HYDPIDRAFT_175437 [Hydnomerulius pinastri MD-312]
MERLCDEIIELILYELNDPTALTLTSKRFLHVSRDPYVRAHYFLTRFGHMDAMFWALGRGKVLNEKVIDILVSSGAYVSRYLVQVAIHHYFRSASHFIKTHWVRTIPLAVFTHFMKVTSGLFDEIPLNKNEDDGYIFHSFLKESRLPPDLKSTKWEDVREILDKYRVLIIIQDPLMAQLPIALAIEPRLLPYAEANGFRMDPKYRDFVFRKMFEKQALNSLDRTDDIIRNVRELRRLDPRMFLSRTVAAEICMEAKSNESAYRALKSLDRSGELLFPLAPLVTELTKLFVKTRSITTTYTVNVLRQLYADFPSSDPTVRTVMLLTVFLSDSTLSTTVTPLALATLKAKLEALNLTPLTKDDLLNVMTNPFVEKLTILLEFAKEMEMSAKAIKDLVQEVAVQCLEIGSKGKTLRKLADGHMLHSTLADAAMQRYSISLDDLPPSEDEKACAAFEAPLCRDFNNSKVIRANASTNMNAVTSSSSQATPPTEPDAPGDLGEVDEAEMDMREGGAEGIVIEEGPEEEAANNSDTPELGVIGQDTLSAMIRQDEMAPTRSRRRSYYYNIYGADTTGKLNYPLEFLQVGKWVKENYEPTSPIMAVFLTHAIINNNTTLLHQYLSSSGTGYTSTTCHVPITLKHFKLLAHLGRAPNWCLYHEIELGAEFYFSEDDYLSKQAPSPEMKRLGKSRARLSDIKKETSPPTLPRSSCQAGPSSSRTSNNTPPRTSRRRPRRSTATVAPSYVIPDSDDEAIVEDDGENDMVALLSMQAKKRKVESNLQRWIKHLSALLVDEQRKHKDKRKRLEKMAATEGKRRVTKSEFHKSLTIHLRSLRKVDLDKRKQLYGPDAAEEDYSDDDDDDDEYHYQNARAAKRRRITT